MRTTDPAVSIGRERRDRPSIRRCSLAALALLAVTAPARAGLLVQTPEVSLSSGQTSGSFDVTLTDTSTSDSYTISGFSFGLSAASPVTFTNATTATGTPPPYIFTHSLAISDPVNFPLSFDFSGGPVSSFTASDADTDTTATGYVTITPGETVGLAHVLFQIAAGSSAGPFTLQLNSSPDVTNFTDGSLNPIDSSVVTTRNGSVTITPEPSTIMMTISGGSFGLLVFLRRRWGKNQGQRALCIVDPENWTTG